jgi:hypothetical protein
VLATSQQRCFNERCSKQACQSQMRRVSVNNMAYTARSCGMTAVALICFASPSGAQNPRPLPDTARHADSTIAQMKAAQKALPIDPRERIADDSDRAAAETVLGEFHRRGDEVLWKALRRAANPAVRAYLIELIAPSGIAARVITQRLRTWASALRKP